MKIIGTEDIKLENTVVTIGKFDCFHKGHQLLFKTAAEMKTDGMEQVIFMFDIRSGMAGREDVKYIVSRQERRKLALGYGIDHCVEYPFTEETRKMTPEEFVCKVLIGKLGVKAAVAGDDFRFGINRSGDADTLVQLGRKYGFDVRIVERLKYKGREICSTDIRAELEKGNIADVNEMLGRPYSISGQIIEGAHVGTGMGIPTINIDIPDDKLLPPFGVYATKTVMDGTEYVSITNIGKRPTFYDDSKTVAETFILDIEGNLYGKDVRVDLYEHVRDEKKFESAKALYGQISKDVQTVRDYFRQF
ncbi:MAG: bifunctional riboflavin kinase/FAD synthetase [Lachnospiraceae bacterium]|nr:bifunctional riboflavin kinase/FAD synthetase [Lachnospiraceae bacterium]